MPFDLQSDLPGRALPDALRTLLVQQTEALGALLDHAKHTTETIRANEHLSPQAQMTQVAALAQEVSERLSTLADQRIQMQTQIEEFQRLLKLQENHILGHTMERVKEVLAVNLRVARQQLDALIHRQSTS